MTVEPLIGPKALSALNAFNMLLVGLSMLPGMGGLEFLDAIGEMGDDEREKLIRRAITIVPLQQAEIEALAYFVRDKNGIAYKASNIASLTIPQMHEVLTAVCLEIGKIRVTLVTESEKKNSENSPSTFAPHI